MEDNAVEVVWQILEQFVAGSVEQDCRHAVVEYLASCTLPKEIDYLLTRYIGNQEEGGLQLLALETAARHLLDTERHILLVASLQSAGLIDCEKAAEMLDFISPTLDSSSSMIRAVLVSAFQVNHERKDALEFPKQYAGLVEDLDRLLNVWRDNCENSDLIP